MDSPEYFCEIISYRLNIKKSTGDGITQLDSNCADSELCKTVQYDTSREFNFTFNFEVVSNAKDIYKTLFTTDYNVTIICGAEIQTV